MKKTGIVLWSMVFALITAASWGMNKAGVVIQNSTGEIITRCVEFNEIKISVLDLLKRSDFKMILNQTETSLCFLHDDGRADCTVSPNGWVWNMYTLSNGNAENYTRSIADLSVANYSVFAFVYGEPWKDAPPPLSYEEVCERNSVAAIVVDHSNGRRVIKTVDFYGETLSGLQLLKKSGLNVVTYESVYGIGICSINGEGQPADTCYGDPLGRFWLFNILPLSSKWFCAPYGVSDSIAWNGDIHGYMFTADWTKIPEPLSYSYVFPGRGFIDPSSAKNWEQY